MARFPKIFDSKTGKQFRHIFSICRHIRILCQFADDRPTVMVTGQDADGNKHAAEAQIGMEWISSAICSGQFVAAVIDELRDIAKGSPIARGSKFKQRREFLDRTFVHGALLPLLDE